MGKSERKDLTDSFCTIYNLYKDNESGEGI